MRHNVAASALQCKRYVTSSVLQCNFACTLNVSCFLTCNFQSCPHHESVSYCGVLRKADLSDRVRKGRLWTKYSPVKEPHICGSGSRCCGSGSRSRCCGSGSRCCGSGSRCCGVDLGAVGCLRVCLFVCLSVCLSVRLSVSGCLTVVLGSDGVCVPVFLSFRLADCLLLARRELYTSQAEGGACQGNSRYTAPGGRYVRLPKVQLVRPGSAAGSWDCVR